eukprot:TRINITY_DN20470_c0_g1_i1.p3 TRINITY_DN20470_c0_g1~~TRINITY_DN20470_c0_g1_i1.p3  ORF type:complete len:111 (+),score=19.50 TRINITY_DN20470_c0_g1_i1:163-495(+)
MGKSLSHPEVFSNKSAKKNMINRQCMNINAAKYFLPQYEKIKYFEQLSSQQQRFNPNKTVKPLQASLKLHCLEEDNDLSSVNNSIIDPLIYQRAQTHQKKINENLFSRFQ